MNVKAFFTSLITWYLIFPSTMLCFAAMKNQLRYDVKKTRILVISTLLSASLVVAVLKSLFVIPRNALIPIIIIPSYIVYSKSVKAPVYKSLSVAVLVFAFMSFFVNIANGFDAEIHPHGVLNDFSLEAAIFQAVIATIFTALVYRPVSRSAPRIIDGLDVPRVYIASVPVWGIFLVFNLLISPRKYETLHVNLMQIAYWGTLILFLTLLFLLCVLFYYIVSDMMEKAAMEEKNRMLEIQESFYQAQMRYIDENARVRHDFKHTIATLDDMSVKGDLQAIRDYINQYKSLQPERETMSFCKNVPVNAIINHYAHLAENTEIAIDLEIDIPKEPCIPDVELCSLLGNILENAILACDDVPEPDRFIDLAVRIKGGSNLIIVCTNSFDGSPRMKDGQYLSTRSGGSGLGLKSIASTAAKYGGIARFYHEGKEFCSDVMIPIGVQYISENS